MTDTDRWKRARAIFDTVVELEPAAVASRLDEVCGNDIDLKREVESLLAFDRRSHDTIARVVSDAALSAAGRVMPAEVVEIHTVFGRSRVI